MKTIKILFAIVIAFVTTHSVNAQSDKTERTNGIKTQTIKVYGECVMCKKRIEKAVSTVEGIKSVIWNEDTKVLTIKYSVFKKEVDDNVEKKVASIGYDTEKYSADDAAYKQLPDCCKYQRKQS
jgi:periplasmic mercuric ion binding protein